MKDKNESSAALVVSDEKFLEQFGDKWFRAAVGRMLRIEEQWDKLIGFGADEMPTWAAVSFGKTADVFGVKLVRPELMDAEHFGKILGAKVVQSRTQIFLLTQLQKPDSASRAKITNFLNKFSRILASFSVRAQMRDLSAPQWIEILRKFQPLAQRIEALSKAVRSKVHRLSLAEEGRFHRGYGSGLLYWETVKEWMKKENPREKSSAYIRSFIFLNWALIEEIRKNGTWLNVHMEFLRSLPDGTVITAGAFEQELRRAGIGDFGASKNPKKSDNNRL